MILTIFFSIFSVFSLCCIVLSYMKSFILKHSFMTYILVSIEFSIMIVWFNFIGLISYSSEGNNIYFDTIFNSESIFYIVSMIILFIISVIFFYLYHKNESVNKINQYFSRKQALQGSSSFALIFSLVMLFKIFFNGNVTFGKIIWMVIPILMTALLPSGILGGLFSAAYIRKYPDRKEL